VTNAGGIAVTTAGRYRNENHREVSRENHRKVSQENSGDVSSASNHGITRRAVVQRRENTGRYRCGRINRVYRREEPR